MSAAQYGIRIEQHADFIRSFQIQSGGVALNLTGHTFAAQIRERYQSSTATEFTVTVLDAATGTLQLSLTDTQTASLEPGVSVWDLVMTTPAGADIRLLEGSAQVRPGVTR